MRIKMNAPLGDRVFVFVVTVLLVALCLVILYPLYYVVVASFTDPTVVSTGKPLLWVERFYVKGYQTALGYAPLWRSYRNTVLYTAVGTALSLAVTLPAGYAFSRVDMAGRKPLMFLFTFTMFFSGGIIPLYVTIRNLGIYNSIWAIVLPTAVSVYNLIVCRSFFESGVPTQLLEASKLDGCSDFGFFFKVALPLSKTIVAVMCLFYATAIWNQFFNALMFLQDDKKMPLQVVLRSLVLMNQANSMGSSGTAAIDMQKLADQLKYCVVVLSSVPLLAVYPFLQKYFAAGVTMGAVKG